MLLIIICVELIVMNRKLTEENCLTGSPSGVAWGHPRPRGGSACGRPHLSQQRVRVLHAPHRPGSHMGIPSGQHQERGTAGHYTFPGRFFTIS